MRLKWKNFQITGLVSPCRQKSLEDLILYYLGILLAFIGKAWHLVSEDLGSEDLGSGPCIWLFVPILSLMHKCSRQ